jgi:DNA-binding SARP family transcriptional activator
VAEEQRQRDLVPRRRLLDRLDDRFRCRLVLIEAGAGFGKTTVLRQAVAESLAIDSARELVVNCAPDGRTGGSARAVVAALAAQLGCEATPTAIADAAIAVSPRHMVLWIDDVHHLTGSLQLIIDLLEQLPTNGHLVLIGRQVPKLPTARLVVDGQVSHLDEDDVRFDDDERSAFFHLRGASVDVDTISASSGWPALMELELASGRSGAADYLTEEVLVDTDERRITALKRLAQVDSIDDTMVRNVTKFDGGIAELVAGLPLVHLDESAATPDGDRATVAVLHDLLRDALLSQTSPAEAAAAASAIGNELLGRHDHVGAARRFVDAGDSDGIALVAQRLLDDLHFATSVDDRLAAVDIVRQELGDSPTALTLHAVTLAIVDPINSEAALAEARSAADAAGRTDLVALCLVRLAELAYGRGDALGVAQVGDEVDALKRLGEPVAARLGFLLDVWVRRLTGRAHEIVELIDDLIEQDALIDDEMRAVALFYRTISLAYNGHVREALAEVERNAADLPPGLFADRLGGFVTIQHWMLGEQSDEILQQASRLVDRIETRGQADLFVEGAATTAIFHATRGELTIAERLVERAEAKVETLPDQAWGRHTISQARAVVDVLRGDEASAATRLDRTIPSGGPHDGLPSHLYNLTAALSYLLVPRTREAWEATHTAPDLDVRTEVGRALVALREEGDVAPAAALPWHEVHRLRPWALEPHLVELGVAAVAGGERNGLSALIGLRHDPLAVLDRLTSSGDDRLGKAATEAIRITPRRPHSAIDLGVLGPLSVARNGVEEADTPAWRRARVRDLLSLLVFERKVSRARTAEVLWPDKAAKAGQNNLRVNLSHLLDAFEPTRVGASPSWFVRVESDSLRLDESEFLRLDVDRFSDLVATARGLDTTAPRQALDAHLAACELFRGEYLVGSSIHDAAYFESLRLRGAFVDSSVRAADLLLSIGEHREAERVAMRASAIEPLNESSQRVLAAALLAQRRVGAASEVLHHLLRQLGEIKIPPEPETARLATRLGIDLSQL